MSRLLYAPTTANVDHVSSTTETTWASWSIPANTLGAAGCLHVVILFDFLNNTGSGDTVTLRVKYGATTLFDDLSGTIASSASRRDGRCEFWLASDGATNSQLLRGYWVVGAPTAATTGTGDFAGNLGNSGTNWGGSSSEDSTAAKTLAVTVQNTTNSANLSTRLLYAFVEVL